MRARALGRRCVEGVGVLGRRCVGCVGVLGVVHSALPAAGTTAAAAGAGAGTLPLQPAAPQGTPPHSPPKPLLRPPPRQVDYPSPELALQGGTPSFLHPLLHFCQLTDLWAEAGAGASDSDSSGGDGSDSGDGRLAEAVEALHAHVLALHERFLAGLAAAEAAAAVATGPPPHAAIRCARLVPAAPEPAARSHTLVFRQPDAAAAAAAVRGLAARGVLVDCRGASVRVGFGPNHCAVDVDALLAVLAAAAPAASA